MGWAEVEWSGGGGGSSGERGLVGDVEEEAGERRSRGVIGEEGNTNK